MNGIRTQTQAQIEVAGMDMQALSAHLAQQLPQRNGAAIEQLSALLATAAMIENPSLLMHVIDAAALALQAEAGTQDPR